MSRHYRSHNRLAPLLATFIGALALSLPLCSLADYQPPPFRQNKVDMTESEYQMVAPLIAIHKQRLRDMLSRMNSEMEQLGMSRIGSEQWVMENRYPATSNQAIKKIRTSLIDNETQIDQHLDTLVNEAKKLPIRPNTKDTLVDQLSYNIELIRRNLADMEGVATHLLAEAELLLTLVQRNASWSADGSSFTLSTADKGRYQTIVNNIYRLNTQLNQKKVLSLNY